MEPHHIEKSHTVKRFELPTAETLGTILGAGDSFIQNEIYSGKGTEGST